jgi:hypothetical protein
LDSPVRRSACILSNFSSSLAPFTEKPEKRAVILSAGQTAFPDQAGFFQGVIFGGCDASSTRIG